MKIFPPVIRGAGPAVRSRRMCCVEQIDVIVLEIELLKITTVGVRFLLAHVLFLKGEVAS